MTEEVGLDIRACDIHIEKKLGISVKMAEFVAVIGANIAGIAVLWIEAKHGMILVKVQYPDCKFKSMTVQS